MTAPAIWIAPPYSRSFSVSVVFPASVWEMIANVLRRAISRARVGSDTAAREDRRRGPRLNRGGPPDEAGRLAEHREAGRAIGSSGLVGCMWRRRGPQGRKGGRKGR